MTPEPPWNPDRMKHVLFPIALVIACALPIRAQWIEDPAVDSLLRTGIRATYNLEFDGAESAFQRVARARPDHPAGRFFLAMIDWWRIMLDPENESRDETFLDKLDRVIDMCETRLDKNERDIVALFFKGGSIGFRGRLFAMRKEWVKAAREGKDALPIVTDAARLAPKNADIDLGTGIYNYYAAILPERYPVLKPVMLFLPSGDRTKGLRELENAAENARYANWEAAYFLVQALASYENKPSQALPYAKRLSEEFPRNPVFQRTLGRQYVRLSNWQEAARVFQQILERSTTGAFGYGKSAEREAHYYIGFDAMVRRDYTAAIRHFVRCDEISRELDTDGPSGFMVMANLRLGMVHDLVKQRPFAVKQYDKVLDMKDYGGAHDQARQFKKQPYTN